MNKVYIIWGCEDCGSSVLLLSTRSKSNAVNTEAGSAENWWAYDGEEAICVECKRRHMVSADEDGAQLIGIFEED